MQLYLLKVPHLPCFVIEIMEEFLDFLSLIRGFNPHGISTLLSTFYLITFETKIKFMYQAKSRMITRTCIVLCALGQSLDSPTGSH